MNSQTTTTSQDASSDGRWLLAHPILPLVRIVHFLYLTGPFDKVAEVLEQLLEPIAINASVYQEPARLLAPYLPILTAFEAEKAGREKADVIVLDEQGQLLEGFTALGLWVAQRVMTAELAHLNSILCRPCACTLCCEGPVAAEDGREAKQYFFEIPLTDVETELFELPVHNSVQSRSLAALDEPGLTVDGQPFYERPAALYNWRTGWSLILPRSSVCPHLERQQRSCTIYPHRPEVCRRPQIFSYVLERVAEHDEERGGHLIPAYCSRNKLLAVWDCPYVRRFKEEIVQYAALCELEPVFKENKG